jgi:hypothetical protein
MNADYVSLDFDQRLTEAPPPQGDGYRTMPGSTHRTGLPETRPYRYQRGESVLTPAEIVARLREEITARAVQNGETR